jgi:hypothetical protein
MTAPRSPHRRLRRAARAVGAGAGILALLAVAALVVPSSEVTRDERLGQETVSFVYGAAVESEGGMELLTTGEPIPLPLAQPVAIGLDYFVDSEEPVEVTGRWNAELVLVDDRGWTRVIPLARPRQIQGPHARLGGQLAPWLVARSIDDRNRETGVRGRFTLDVRTRIERAGGVGEEPLRGSFSPSLRFEVENGALVPVRRGLTQTRDVAGSRREDRRVSALGAEVTVRAARWALLEGTVLFALLAAGLLVAAGRHGPRRA